MDTKTLIGACLLLAAMVSFTDAVPKPNGETMNEEECKKKIEVFFTTTYDNVPKEIKKLVADIVSIQGEYSSLDDIHIMKVRHLYTNDLAMMCKNELEAAMESFYGDSSIVSCTRSLTDDALGDLIKREYKAVRQACHYSFGLIGFEPDFEKYEPTVEDGESSLEDDELLTEKDD